MEVAVAHRLVRASCLLAALFVVVGGPAALAQEEIYVTNANSNTVTVYARTASGNIAPLRTLVGAATGLATPRGVAVDRVNNELFVVNHTPPESITVYPRTANGNVAPLRTITGAGTTLADPTGLSVDPVNNEIAVANRIGAYITIYSRTATGNATPLRTLIGGSTSLSNPTDVVIDVVNNELVVANNGRLITVYARTASGNVSPGRTISGATTGFNNGPIGIAVDTVNNEFEVTNPAFGPSFLPSVLAFSRTATGDVAPLRAIDGAATGLSTNPNGVAVDTVNNELAMANGGNNSIRVWTRTADGNAAPLRVISGGLTLLNNPQYLVVLTGAVSSHFFTVTPCRVVDTRGAGGPFGGPALAINADRAFVIGGQCGIPLTAKSVSFNLTITGPTDAGDLRVFPSGGGLPLVSTSNWRSGQTRANNAVVGLGDSGGITVHPDQATGAVHVIIDVNGYYQ
jgi:DNA-binding beta-propeller fold protein YncE